MGFKVKVFIVITIVLSFSLQAFGKLKSEDSEKIASLLKERFDSAKLKLLPDNAKHSIIKTVLMVLDEYPVDISFARVKIYINKNKRLFTEHLYDEIIKSLQVNSTRNQDIDISELNPFEIQMVVNFLLENFITSLLQNLSYDSSNKDSQKQKIIEQMRNYVKFIEEESEKIWKQTGLSKYEGILTRAANRWYEKNVKKEGSSEDKFTLGLLSLNKSLPILTINSAPILNISFEEEKNRITTFLSNLIKTHKEIWGDELPPPFHIKSSDLDSLRNSLQELTKYNINQTNLKKVFIEDLKLRWSIQCDSWLSKTDEKKMQEILNDFRQAREKTLEGLLKLSPNMKKEEIEKFRQEIEVDCELLAEKIKNPEPFWYRPLYEDEIIILKATISNYILLISECLKASLEKYEATEKELSNAPSQTKEKLEKRLDEIVVLIAAIIKWLGDIQNDLPRNIITRKIFISNESLREAEISENENIKKSLLKIRQILSKE